MKPISYLPLLTLPLWLVACIQRPLAQPVDAPVRAPIAAEEVERDWDMSDIGNEAERIIEDGEEAEEIIGLADEEAGFEFDDDAETVIDLGAELETGLRINDG